MRWWVIDDFLINFWLIILIKFWNFIQNDNSLGESNNKKISMCTLIGYQNNGVVLMASFPIVSMMI